MTGRRLRFAAFDFDGTLLDSADGIVTTIRATWRALGLPEPEEAAARRIIGLSLAEGVRELLKGHDPAEIERVQVFYDEVVRGVRPRPAPLTEPRFFPGALELLENLSADGYVLGIVTGRRSQRLHAILEAEGIAHHFVTLKTADHGPSKPNPHNLLEAMAEVGAAPHQSVMVGDTSFDIEMARNAGIGAIGVSWGVHGPDELREAGAHHVVDAFGELPPLLDALTGRAR